MVVDDEPLALQLLCEYVKKTPGLELMHQTTNAIEALEWVQQGKVELVFLDIQMPELTGIQFMKIIKNKCRVILTTAYSEYAMDGYEHDVVDYLLKPITYDRFVVAVNKARDRIRDAVKMIATEQLSTHIFIKTEYRIQKVDFDDIYYLEGMRDYIAFHTRQGKIMTLQSMKQFEEILPATLFARIHRSYMIAVNKIQFLEKNRVIVNGQYLPIGDGFRDEFMLRIKRES